MSTNNPSPPLAPIGGTIELAGHLFEVTGHATDRLGRPCEVPGRCLGKATKQTKRAGHSVVATPQTPSVSAPTAPSSPPLTPSSPRKARRPRASHSSYGRYRPKPPPLVIHQEPASLGVWLCRLAVAALVVAALVLWGQGSEARKWRTPSTSATTPQRR